MSIPDTCKFCGSEAIEPGRARWECGTFLTPEIFPEWQRSAICKRFEELEQSIKIQSKRYVECREEVARLDRKIAMLESSSGISRNMVYFETMDDAGEDTGWDRFLVDTIIGIFPDGTNKSRMKACRLHFSDGMYARVLGPFRDVIRNVAEALE